MYDLFRAYVTLFRRISVFLLYMFAVVFHVASYQLFSDGNYYQFAIFGIGAPIAAVILHIILNKLLLRFELRDGKKYEEIRLRQPGRFF